MIVDESLDEFRQVQTIVDKSLDEWTWIELMLKRAVKKNVTLRPPAPTPLRAGRKPKFLLQRLKIY